MIRAQILARHADPQTTEHYDRPRGNLDRHGVHFLTSYVAGGQPSGSNPRTLDRPRGASTPPRMLIDSAGEVISPGTTIHTDGARMFTRLAGNGYTHHATPGYKADDLDAVMPGPYLVSSLLKRWTAGTLHHRISYQHLPYYLDEFTFRFNQRTSKARGMLFYRLLQQAVDTDPHPLKELVGG